MARKIIVGLFFTTFIAGVILLVVWVPEVWIRQYGRLNCDAAVITDQYRRTIIQGLGGLALLIGLYFTNRNIKISEEGKFTERFSQAIDKLGGQDKDGSKITSLRLGGIYGLQRLAYDSRVDLNFIVEVLVSYIRENGPRDDTPQSTTPLLVQQDCLAAIRILGEMGHKRDRRKRALDLSYVSCVGADCSGCKFVNVNFDHSQLTAAEFSSAEFAQVSFQQSELSDASFESAKISGSESSFRDATLMGTSFTDSTVRHTSFAGARLDEADFTSARLENVSFYASSLKRANFRGVTLRNVSFEGCDLLDVTFNEADLTGADFRLAENLTATQLGLAKSQPAQDRIPPTARA